MGSNSFSKDHSLSLSGDIGELSLSEAYLPRVSPKSGEVHQSGEPYISPASAAAAAAAKALDEARKAVKEDVADQPNPEASISIQTDSDLSRSSDSNPPHDDNKGSNEALAPTSTKGSGCPMCRCLWCDGVSNSCSCCHWLRWPSCSSSCISCPSCCKCCGSSPFSSCCCYSWNREAKRVRAVTSYA